MEKFSIDSFSPKKAELVTLADKYKSLQIKDIEDKEGYLAVDDARKDLKKKRVEIEKAGKSLREEALRVQKGIIVAEKELISIIGPLEQELKDKQAKIDEEKLMKSRFDLLPQRKEQLKIAEAGDIEDSVILNMNEAEFIGFLNEKRTEKLLRQQQEVRIAEEKIAREKELLAAAEEARLKAEKAEEARVELAKQQIIQEKKAAREAFERQAENAEKEKKRLIEEQRLKFEAEKQKIIDDQKAKEEKEKREKEEKEKKAAIYEAAKKELEEENKKDEKYREFINKHGYQETQNWHMERHEQKDGTRFRLYSLVGEIII